MHMDWDLPLRPHAKHGESGLADPGRCRKCGRRWCVLMARMRSRPEMAMKIVLGIAEAVMASVTIGILASAATSYFGGGLWLQIVNGIGAGVAVLLGASEILGGGGR